MRRDATAPTRPIAPATARFACTTLFARLARPSLAQVGLYAVASAVLAFLLLPSLLVVPMSLSASDYLEFPPSRFSLRWYAAYFEDPDWIRATFFSFRIAAPTACLATLVGTTTALALMRGRIPGRQLLRALIVAPMIMPTIIVAISLYLLFASLHLVGNPVGFILAHTILAVPYVVLTVSAALYRLDPTLELAAMSLGAPRATAVLRVTLPLILPSVLAGATFAFVASFDETTVSFFISGVTGKTLTKKMFEGIESEISPVVAVVSTLLTLASILAVSSVPLLRLRKRRLRSATPLSAYRHPPPLKPPGTLHTHRP